jgi:hypothetical protein
MNPSVDQTLQELKSALTAKQRVLLVGKLFELGVPNRVIEKITKIKGYQIRHYLRVHQKLSPEAMVLFQSDKISFSLARAIASLPLKQQEKAARNAIAKRTSVARFRSGLKGNADRKLNAGLERLGDQYSALSGLDITIKADKENPKAGEWKIRYTDLDMFDTIADTFLKGKRLEDF